MNLRPVPPSLHSSFAASKAEEATLAPFSHPVNPMFKHYLRPGLNAAAQILGLCTDSGALLSTEAPRTGRRMPGTSSLPACRVLLPFTPPTPTAETEPRVITLHSSLCVLSRLGAGPDKNPVKQAAESSFFLLPRGLQKSRLSPGSPPLTCTLVALPGLVALNSIYTRKIPEPVPVSPAQTSLSNPSLLYLPAFPPSPRGCLADSSGSMRSKPSTRSSHPAPHQQSPHSEDGIPICQMDQAQTLHVIHGSLTPYV